MTSVAIWDTETNGLLVEASKMHCVGADIDGVLHVGHDAPHLGPQFGTHTLVMPDGSFTAAEMHTLEDCLRLIARADLRVAHNGDDFDERVTRKLYPWWDPTAPSLDTLLLSKLLYPQIYHQGPNSHRCPPQLRMRHSIEAWGWRLGQKKNKEFDAGDWQTFSWDMLIYMVDDIRALKVLFKWLMSRKPPARAVKLEHDFARIIRRQEAWGLTFAHQEALELGSELTAKSVALEMNLIEEFGSFWLAGKERTVATTRSVKLPELPDVTIRRFSASSGKELKPYVGPPKALYEAGAKYTEVNYVQFQPSSPIHVEKLLRQKYGWKPIKLTAKGQTALDGDVLRSLPYPEAPKLADLYEITKILGYVATGKNAWLKTAKEEGSEWRQHGRVNTVGTYTFRCSHSNPNLAQVPSRSPLYGHRCRSLFKARDGFTMMGFDGSGMQLRLMAHHMAKYDEGAYAEVFVKGIDPHAFMRDSIGVDLMGEGDEGRKKGKTIDYALPFGGGELRLGSIVKPHESEKRRREIGKEIRTRIFPVFGMGFDALKTSLKDQVESKGYIIGLDGRKAYCNSGHTGLSTLLQMGEAIVMRLALVLMDNRLRELGLRCGVDGAGIAHPELADYEFSANVHDEAQADVRHGAVETYRSAALWCVAEAGRQLNLRCPLASDCKDGPDWSFTH